ncbi:DUF1499 domain-containing protein [Vibrio sp. 404]|uniref:DUF1499 domain-containing protein n=1 Tax=Vibrio marinisediminis TaxID=2758441 RepID=A0A7W2FTI5_9VIBR|nr:DUF1499 domain-containing protein [Vibrio marinisediminis]MBA5763925.1 DUF1499 domain-containing protein [Vibrio marinisediminis]
MKAPFAVLAIALMLSGCSQGNRVMVNKVDQICADKPNCVSTLDSREDFQIAPFNLKNDVTIDQVEQVALQLPGAKTATQENSYLRIECTSKIMRFVDDLELEIKGSQLIVRSESRVGYSDFGVNRKRAEQLRVLLNEAGLLENN